MDGDLPEFYTENAVVARLGLSHFRVLRRWLKIKGIQPVAALVSSTDRRHALYSAEQVTELDQADDE